MCMKKPKVPKTPPAQVAELPDASVLRDRMKAASRGGAGIIGGSLLTGPQGIGSVPTAKAQLLGQ